MWFDRLQRSARYDEILSVCSSLSADVICFQEVTPYFLGKLVDHPISKLYHCSDEMFEGKSVEPYGVLTLCKTYLNAQFTFTDLPSDMHRKLLTASFQTSEGGLIKVGNVHLESLDSADVRAMQLKVCHGQLGTSPAAILCGDFNFCSYKNYNPGKAPLENDVLAHTLPGYKDAWLELYGGGDSEDDGSKGYTFDTVTNRMIGSEYDECASRREERMRYDRVCYSFNGGNVGIFQLYRQSTRCVQMFNGHLTPCFQLP